MAHLHRCEKMALLLIMKHTTHQPQPTEERAQNGQETGKNGQKREHHNKGKRFGTPFTSETGKAAAQLSAQKMAERKRGRELLTLILEGRTLDADTLQEFARLGIDVEQATNEAALYLAMFRQAMAGDRESPRAFEQIAKVMGWQLERHEISGPDGAPLIPPRTLTPSEVAEMLQELEQTT